MTYLLSIITTVASSLLVAAIIKLLKDHAKIDNIETFVSNHLMHRMDDLEVRLERIESLLMKGSKE